MADSALELKIKMLFEQYLKSGSIVTAESDLNRLESAIKVIEKILDDCERIGAECRAISAAAESALNDVPATKADVPDLPAAPAVVAAPEPPQEPQWYAKAVDGYSTYVNFKQRDGTAFECFSLSGEYFADADGIEDSDIICYSEDGKGMVIFPNFASLPKKLIRSGRTITYLEFVKQLYIVQNDIRLTSPNADYKLIVRAPFVKGADFVNFSENFGVAEVLPAVGEKRGFIEVV